MILLSRFSSPTRCVVFGTSRRVEPSLRRTIGLRSSKQAGFSSRIWRTRTLSTYCLSNGGLDRDRPADTSEIIFLGTGTSEGIPRVSCLTDPLKKCEVCSKAAEEGNKNRRMNTSILIRHHNSEESFNILIDAGKFFYHSALRWFPLYGIRAIDAVIITHSHADAIGVSALEFKTINEEPFTVHNLKITPLPVWHGPGYRSLGFRFGNVCYISDVSDIPEETYELLAGCDLLILDALRPDRSSATHFGLPRALEEVRKIQPKKTLFTGMMHLMDHDEINKYLESLMAEGLDVQLSHDGLRVPISL
ncbi:metallo-hydrolase/oxidoreductase superfamily protein isoform X2 [Wolffia australiana]